MTQALAHQYSPCEDPVGKQIALSWDAATMIGVSSPLAIASFPASFLPARRAASMNPTDAPLAG
jgi:ABC-type lipoprotein release transport system permease subunit